MALSVAELVALRHPRDLLPDDAALLVLMYKELQAGQPLVPGEILRFETGLSREDLDRLTTRFSLLERQGTDSYRLSLQALLYVPKAIPDLDLIDRFLQLRADRYAPGAQSIPGTSALTALHCSPADLDRIEPFLSSIGAVFEPGTYNIPLHESALSRRSLEQVVAPPPGRDLRIEEDEVGQPNPPFTARVTTLRLRNFRALQNVEIPLAPLTVLVGPNGVGKSTVLSALAFLRVLAVDGLAPAVKGEGGLARLRTRGQTGPLEVGVDLSLDYGRPDRVTAHYQLKISEHLGTLRVDDEVLWIVDRGTKTQLVHASRGRGEILGADGELHPIYLGIEDLALRTLDRRRSPLIEQIREVLRKILLIDRDPLLAAGHGFFLEGPPPVRTSATATAEALLRAAILDPALTARLSALLHELVPQISKARRVEALDGQASIEVAEGGETDWFSLSELSGGTRQMLLLAAQYLDPDPPTALLLEEPDGVVHPSAQAALVDLLRSLAQRSTVIVTTHSPNLVGRLEDSEVLALERGGSGTAVRPLREALRSNRWAAEFNQPGEAFFRAATERRSR